MDGGLLPAEHAVLKDAFARLRFLDSYYRDHKVDGIAARRSPPGRSGIWEKLDTVRPTDEGPLPSWPSPGTEVPEALLSVPPSP